jgi:hypothetical protein
MLALALAQHSASRERMQPQYLYFCTSKASKLSSTDDMLALALAQHSAPRERMQPQYLYFCTSKASKLSSTDDMLALALAQHSAPRERMQPLDFCDDCVEDISDLCACHLSVLVLSY